LKLRATRFDEEPSPSDQQLQLKSWLQETFPGNGTAQAQLIKGPGGKTTQQHRNAPHFQANQVPRATYENRDVENEHGSEPSWSAQPHLHRLRAKIDWHNGGKSVSAEGMDAAESEFSQSCIRSSEVSNSRVHFSMVTNCKFS
jgi:hypothetical protein